MVLDPNCSVQGLAGYLIADGLKFLQVIYYTYYRGQTTAAGADAGRHWKGYLAGGV
jgi:hypothetical protein